MKSVALHEETEWRLDELRLPGWCKLNQERVKSVIYIVQLFCITEWVSFDPQCLLLLVTIKSAQWQAQNQHQVEKNELEQKKEENKKQWSKFASLSSRKKEQFFVEAHDVSRRKNHSDCSYYLSVSNAGQCLPCPAGLGSSWLRRPFWILSHAFIKWKFLGFLRLNLYTPLMLHVEKSRLWNVSSLRIWRGQGSRDSTKVLAKEPWDLSPTAAFFMDSRVEHVPLLSCLAAFIESIQWLLVLHVGRKIICPRHWGNGTVLWVSFCCYTLWAKQVDLDV